MKNLKSALERVLNSELYKEWSRRNKDFYLTSFFRIIGDNEPEDWQVDFYNKDSDTITSFMASEEPSMLQEGSKIFKKAHEKLKKLDINDVNVGLGDALIAVDKLVHTKYRNESPSKKIVILQNIGKNIWNITYLTTAFNILNVKIDASNGKIIQEELRSALSLR